MRYYLLKNQVDTEEVGRNIYPQTDGLLGKETFNSNSSYSIFSHHNLPHKFEPIEKIKLGNSANQTDFISTGIISGFGFIISKRVKDILESHNIVNHKFYNIPIIHKNTELNQYYWIHMYQPEQHYVDFKSSIFQVKKFRRVIKEQIKFDSIEDYWLQRKKYKPGELFKAKEVYINPENYDLLYLGVGGTQIIISERLLNSFKENLVTGHIASEMETIKIKNTDNKELW